MFDAHHHETLQSLRRRLFGYACALSRELADAEDLYQDAMVRAMAAASVPRDSRAFRVWMFRLMRNLWIDRLRREGLRAGLIDPEVEPEAQPGPGGEESLVNVLLVRAAFQRLSKDHRDVLALVDIAGFSYEETAELLETPRGTVMSRISRARAALAAQLQDAAVVPFPARRGGRR
ncbi:RNA polymerase sigma factor [Pararhodobacter sp. SW119]|uniref:RNA polymerase sigma factor n=1 Tax=Pararhodobacter sp. SW119 TaxID=2780075 RepID=UPI001ADFF3CA